MEHDMSTRQDYKSSAAPCPGEGSSTICQSKNLFKEITKMVKSGTESQGASIIWGYIWGYV
jgi:hypothetical protein